MAVHHRHRIQIVDDINVTLTSQRQTSHKTFVRGRKCENIFSRFSTHNLNLAHRSTASNGFSASPAISEMISVRGKLKIRYSDVRAGRDSTDVDGNK